MMTWIPIPMPERQEHAIVLQREIAALPPDAASHQPRNHGLRTAVHGKHRSRSHMTRTWWCVESSVNPASSHRSSRALLTAPTDD